eukprot:CAMPEP_0172916076 /NCGR_PEP_ID=MMETSP1075-20121228/195552_1 /TAXON_ID=2916 /ORGANISM="Ceratium fusus, Strain PA161109" /LENGTH=62 /DNA_ID=CAMNT_0013775285 /DNA_START=269 /DNA_END=457 /DNA_ORIENTATION=-
MAALGNLDGNLLTAGEHRKCTGGSYTCSNVFAAAEADKHFDLELSSSVGESLKDLRSHTKIA